MKDKNIVYFNKFAQLKSATEVELSTPEGEKEVITSKYILIATGGRPTYPDIPGAQELSITSDDIFWREQNPGKTLVVGASYIALETAGFMQELGIDVTVMVRSIFLRGFDQQLANKVADYMQKIGVKFVRDSVPASIEKATEEGWKTVKYQTTTDGKTTDHEDKFETVLFAIGRSAETKNMCLENVGIQLAKNGKIIVDESDKTAVDSVYALGDVVDGRLELTPPAITSGKLLVHRLFGAATTKLDYRFIPTTIFTPLEYGACGYAEEDAIKEFGK
jgi:thioredoxin reductase (NADPH)